MTDLHIPNLVRSEFTRQTTEYIKAYETHEASVWAESPEEAASDITRLAEGFAAYAISAYLKWMATERDRAVKVHATIPGTEADVELMNEFTAELRKHAELVVEKPKDPTN